jgi:hypothetical protein
MTGTDCMDDVGTDRNLAPIDSPAAWRGGDLEGSDAWRRRLTETEIAALIRAAGATRVPLRVWLSTPFSRLLPSGHAVHWGDTRPGALRGGALVGRHAIIA